MAALTDYTNFSKDRTSFSTALALFLAQKDNLETILRADTKVSGFPEGPESIAVVLKELDHSHLGSLLLEQTPPAEAMGALQLLLPIPRIMLLFNMREEPRDDVLNEEEETRALQLHEDLGDFDAFNDPQNAGVKKNAGSCNDNIPKIDWLGAAEALDKLKKIASECTKEAGYKEEDVAENDRQTHAGQEDRHDEDIKDDQEDGGKKPTAVESPEVKQPQKTTPPEVASRSGPLGRFRR